MVIADIARVLEAFAPLSLQEEYDNAGLLIGSSDNICTGILCTLDVTEKVIEEAISKECNCIVAHHPVIFRGLKKITGSNEIERIVMKALQNNIAVYAAHTNLDNVIEGVNGKIADKLALKNRSVLSAKKGTLKKLYTFVPTAHLDIVRDALFSAGAGEISNYSECSFTHAGTGTFKPGAGSDPYSGTPGERKNEEEIKLEVILPAHREASILRALFESHPYEEVAYDLISLDNNHQGTGSGILGELDAVDEASFLSVLQVFNPHLIRHTPFSGKKIRKVAVCGGAGSFLIKDAMRNGADAFVTADIKYHDFFVPEGKMLLCDIGHFESEQFTIDLFCDILLRNFPNFAVLKSEVKTNPVHYFTGN